MCVLFNYFFKKITMSLTRNLSRAVKTKFPFISQIIYEIVSQEKP